MYEPVENVSTPAPDVNGALLQGIKLGSWMGRREAFGAMAGRCSAADIVCLKTMRDSRGYREIDCTWADFCTKHLKVSRRNVDRLIGYLEEFGPAYFQLSHLTHISVSDYRQIAASVTEEGISLDGSVVALLPENSGQLSEAISELLARINPGEETQQIEAGPVAPPVLPSAPVLALPAEIAPEPAPSRQIVTTCRDAIAILRGLESMEYVESLDVTAAISDLYLLAKAKPFLHMPGR